MTERAGLLQAQTAHLDFTFKANSRFRLCTRCSAVRQAHWDFGAGASVLWTSPGCFLHHQLRLSPPTSSTFIPSGPAVCPAAFSSASNPPASWFDEDTPLSQSPWLPTTCTPGLQDPLSPLPTSPHHIDWTPHSPSTQTQMGAPHTHPYVPSPGVFTFPPFESLSVPNAPSPGRFPTPQLAASLRSPDPVVLHLDCLDGASKHDFAFLPSLSPSTVVCAQ